MKVLLVTGSFPPLACGVGDYTHALAGALAECDEVRVAVLTSTGADPHRGARYDVFPVMRRWTPDEFPALMEVVRSWKPDVVHVQSPTQGYQGSLPILLPMLLRVRGIPVVQTWHEHVPSHGRPIDLVLVTLRDLPQILFGRDVVVVRNDFEERLPWWYRVLAPRKRYHLIPSAPALPRVELTASERESVRARWGAAGKRMLVFFGFCYEHKGIDDLLDALDPERDRLVIAGNVVKEDPYQAALVRRLQEPPLSAQVTMTGFLPPDAAAAAMAAADAVVLPFRAGGGPWNTSLKAAALQGTFVVTTSAQRHGLDPESNVYWARPRDPADLAQAIAAYAGRRVGEPSPLARPEWPEIARQHLEVYGINL